MAEYIYLLDLDVDKNIVNEIYDNYGNVEWNLNSKIKHKVNDIIYFYTKSISASVCMNERISYVGKVTEITSCGKAKMNIKPILIFATDLLTKKELSEKDKCIEIYNLYPIELQYHNELKKHIDKILSEKKYKHDNNRRVCLINAVPFSYEECMMVDYYNLVRIYETQNKLDTASVNKINGSVASSVIIKYIKAVIDKYKLPYKVSEPNVFILESNVEMDALILNKDAKSIMNSGIYNPEDVVAMLEFKSNGIYSHKNNPFDKFIDICKHFYKHLKDKKISVAAYITISEYMPIKSNSIDFYVATKNHFSELINLPDFNFKLFCVKKRYGKNDELYCNDYDWEKFILSLLP